MHEHGGVKLSELHFTSSFQIAIDRRPRPHAMASHLRRYGQVRPACAPELAPTGGWEFLTDAEVAFITSACDLVEAGPTLPLPIRLRRIFIAGADWAPPRARVETFDPDRKPF